MTSVLAMHKEKEKTFAPQKDGPGKTIRDLAGRGKRCFHCHQVKETIDAQAKRAGKWESALAWRYPPPETVGVTLEVDRGNVVKRVAKESVAEKLGLKAGDVLKQLGDMPLHSQADVQTALDRAPRTGKLALSWTRGETGHKGDLELVENWRKHDLSWRPSLRHMIPSFRLSGKDLSAEEKKKLGLEPTQLAFRPTVQTWAKAAGVLESDVVLGLDGRSFTGLSADRFRDVGRRDYLVGDKIAIDILREGKRMKLPATMR